MSEWSAVQQPMYGYAHEIGWEFVSPAEALKLRCGEQGLFFNEVLEEHLVRLNPGIVDQNQAQEIVRRLALLKPSIEGNRDMLDWLRGEQSVFVPAESRERNVRLIDFENPDNNRFNVTVEWRYRGVVYANRADLVFVINGIPVAVAETKYAGKRDGLAEGVDQIRRYHRETPEMLVAPQVFEVTELLGFSYGATWSVSRKNIFAWKDDDASNFEAKVRAFFHRPTFLKLLRDYIVFVTKDDELSKVILRQHQTRAVEKVVERVQDSHKRRGLVWHTQGSGKTLTMITIAARLLRDAPGAEKPTVLMIVDRTELEEQLFKNIVGYGITGVAVANSKTELRSLLASDQRGLVVSMIHKFDDIPAALNTRSSITVLIDEAHRSTGGDLGTYLEAALPNATLIGFTGTPIDRLSKGQGTFKVFGKDDQETGYTDKYSIRESVEDGTTVSLNYALAPSSLMADKELLEKQFLSLAESEGVSEIEELNAILGKAVELKEMMKAADRVERIAAHVAKHFRENVEPMGFKAFLVGVDREACALYKKALDQHLPTEWSQVVYSPAHNDQQNLKAHYLAEDDEKALRKAFPRKETLPKILIVTEKLLTGFDAPILYAMYLDKPMRDHVLLQAIARVNRPYEDESGLVKPFGFVLDYVGIFEKLEKALAFDSDTVASVIQNIDVLKSLLATMMAEQAPQYLPLTRGWDDKAKEAAVEHFRDQERRETFFRWYRQLQSLYEIISPDAFLRPYIDDFKALTELFGFIRSAFGNRIYVDKELTEKTKQLLQLHTTSTAIELPGEVTELGVAELEAIRRRGGSDTVKVINLRKLLGEAVERDAEGKPYLINIGERAKALEALYEDRQLTTQQALEEFAKLGQEVVEADAKRRELGLNENAFAVYVTLEPVVQGLNADQANSIDAIFSQYPDHKWNDQHQAALRRELYKALRPLVGKDKMISAANDLLRLERL